MFVILVVGIKMLWDTLGLSKTPQKHQQLLRSKPGGTQDHTTNAEDPTSTATAEPKGN